MNDEEFARNAFAQAFGSGFAGEPTTLPDLDRVAAGGRAAMRHRQGVYAAGTVALAGAVTAGVVTGPTLLGLGSGGSPGVSAASGGSSSTAAIGATTSPSEPDVVKPSQGVACATPPNVDWAAVVGAALPADVRFTAPHSVSCISDPGGARSIEAVFKLTSPAGDLQIDVGTGSDASPSGTPGSSASAPSGPNPLGKLDAIKSAAAASAQASADAAKSAAADASASGATNPVHPPGASTTKTANSPVCRDLNSSESVCVSDFAKGGFHGLSVELFRDGAHKLMVQVVATAGSADSTTVAALPLTQAQLIAVAQAVAVHF